MMTPPWITRLACATVLGWSGLAVAQTAAPAASAQPATKAPKTFELESYTPIEVAPGAPGTRPLSVANLDHTNLSKAALAKAQTYSDSFDGHALLVWQGGKLRYEHYGNGLGEDTRFETFSMHKSILGLVYGAALRDGIIHSLDEKAGDYLVEWRNDPRGAITIRQLLTMETGLGLSHGDDQAAVALARISHRWGCIGAPNQRKCFCDKDII